MVNTFCEKNEKAGKAVGNTPKDWHEGVIIRTKILKYMALPINIKDLLNKRKVEGYKIEFKKGWTLADIYHSICDFANDFDNLGDCYVLVEAEENEYGVAKRTVLGINIEVEAVGILKQMVGFNNMFTQFYLPHSSVKEYANFDFDYIQEKLEDHLNYFFKETAFLLVFLGFLNKEEETEIY